MKIDQFLFFDSQCIIFSHDDWGQPGGRVQGAAAPLPPRWHRLHWQWQLRSAFYYHCMTLRQQCCTTILHSSLLTLAALYPAYVARSFCQRLLSRVNGRSRNVKSKDGQKTLCHLLCHLLHIHITNAFYMGKSDLLKNAEANRGGGP